jgi:hypothetical protein
VGRPWECATCGEPNSPDDFVCSACGTVISVDDLLAILREPREPRPRTPPPPKRAAPRRRPSPPPAPTPSPSLSPVRSRTPAPTPRSRTDTVLGCVGIVIILALVGALILGVVALVTFLASGGDGGDGGGADGADASGPPAPCHSRIGELIGDRETSVAAATYRTEELRITLCETPASAEKYGCVIEFDEDGREPVVVWAGRGGGVDRCGDIPNDPFSVKVLPDSVRVYEGGAFTEEQDLVS